MSHPSVAGARRSERSGGWPPRLGALAMMTVFVGLSAGCRPDVPPHEAPPRRAPSASTVAHSDPGAVARSDGGAVARTDGGAPLPDRAVELTVLFTTDEHGWLLPYVEHGQSWGGVSQLFRRLSRDEQHCTGGAPAPSGGADPCLEARTLLLSGGDSFTGPAISSHFRGATMAQAMGRLGYVASALGNHELDFDRVAFDENRRLSGTRYLAANLVDQEGRPSELAAPFVMVRRSGVDVGIVGLALRDTPRVALASRFAGLRFDDVEASLDRVVPRAWQAGADVVVVLAHECADRMIPVLERHPEWALSFVGTGHCHEIVDRLAAGAPVMSPGWRLGRYARAVLRVRPALEGPRQAELVSRSIVEVRGPLGSDAVPDDPELESWVTGWQREVDRALGQVVAVSTVGMARESEAIARWVLRSWLEEVPAEVAVTTRGSIRQDLPAGPITVETIHSILPFENELVVASVPGSVLQSMAARAGTRMVHVARRPDGRVGAALPLVFEPGRSYRVVTTDFLYGGGDDCPFREADPSARFTGLHWRAPVVSWTRSLQTSAARPLEAALGAAEGAAPKR